MVVIVTHTDVKVVMVDLTIKVELGTTSNQNSEVEWVELDVDVVDRQVVDLVLHHHKVLVALVLHLLNNMTFSFWYNHLM